MENLTSLSPSNNNNNNEADQTLSNNNDIGDVEKSSDEYNVLVDKLEEKTGDFIDVICGIKFVIRNGFKLGVTPLSGSAYKKLDAFITSADNIIKWYETDKSRLEAIVDDLLTKVDASNGICNDTVQKFADMEKTIAEQKETITTLKEVNSKLVLDNDVKTTALNEKVDPMNAVQNEMQKRIAELEQKEAKSKECIEKLQIQVNTEKFQLEALKITVKEKDDKIHYLKQKLEEVSRVPPQVSTDGDVASCRPNVAETQMNSSTASRGGFVGRGRFGQSYFDEIDSSGGFGDRGGFGQTNRGSFGGRGRFGQSFFDEKPMTSSRGGFGGRGGFGQLASNEFVQYSRGGSFGVRGGFSITNYGENQMNSSGGGFGSNTAENSSTFGSARGGFGQSASAGNAQQESSPQVLPLGRRFVRY